MTHSLVATGLGSNIDPENNLRKAAEFLRNRFPDIRFSSVYKTAPRGKIDQEDFLNAVAVFQSDQSPKTIATILRAIEADLGKNITERFGPRTIDLDILLYGDTVIDAPDIQVPHPRMHERRFVLEPLCELINAKNRHPIAQKSWHDLLQETQNQTSDKLDNITL